MREGVPLQEKGQKNGSTPKRRMKRTAAGKKGASSEGTPKEESGPHNKPEAGKEEGQGPKGWALWWPKVKEEEGSPTTSEDARTGTPRVQPMTTPRGECSGP